MAEAPLSAFSFFEAVGQLHLNVRDWGHDELGDSVSAVDDKWLGAVVSHDNLDFTPIVCIYGAGGIDQGNSILRREAAARPNLPFIAEGNTEAKTCWNQYEGAWFNFDRLHDGRAKIQPGCVLGHVGRWREIACPW